MQYNFEWDSTKAKANYRKHRVSFERAAEIFRDPFMLSIFDKEHSQVEDRWITIGKDRNDVPLVVVHTFRRIDADNVNIRIISLVRQLRERSNNIQHGNEYEKRV